MIYTKQEEDYVVLFVLYLAGRQPHTYSREWFMYLASWLGAEVNPSYIRTAAVAPDMCGRCLAVFGSTIGGRLRDGCYVCHCRQDTHIWELPYIRDTLKMGAEQLEMLFAKALYIYSRSKVVADYPK